MITVDSPIKGTSVGTVDEVFAYLGYTPTSKGVTTPYLNELKRLCDLVGFDFRILAAQSAHETDDWTSLWWIVRGNPAGIGVTGDPIQDDASPIFKNGADAARAHVVHMAAYVIKVFPITIGKVLGPFVDLDQRFQAVYDADFDGTVKVLGDLGNGKWATDPDYATQIAAKANRIFKEEPVSDPKSVRVVLNPGHRNTTSGNAEEVSLTPALAASYADAFTKAGYDVVNLGDTAGSLDVVGQRMAAAIERAPGECVLFDLHYEGSPAPGCFAIVPDKGSLTTAINLPQLDADSWENNTKDRDLAGRIVDGIHAKTGLALRSAGVRAPGIMDESQTGVGIDGYRLATFAYTSQFNAKAVRLVVEHGNHTIQPDRGIIFTDDFTDKCAAAAVEAVNAVYGLAVAHVETKPGVPWDRTATGIHKLNDANALAFYGRVTPKKVVPLFSNATLKKEFKIGEMRLDETGIIRGTVISGGKRVALVEHDGGVARARLSDFHEKWPTP